MSATPGRERALDLLAMREWTRRREGMQMLIALGERDLILQHALAETDAAAIVDLAVAALHPEPVELIAHYASMLRGQDVNLIMEVHVPTRNYLYAEDAFIELYRPRRTRLKPKVIDTIGLAQFQRMGREFLPRYLAAGKNGDADLSEEAAAAATSLRRLDLPLDALALRARTDAFAASADPFDYPVAQRLARLEWALFDAGEHDAFEYVLTLAANGTVANDLGTTLLKRGRLMELDWFARIHAGCGSGTQAFCHWPLLDYLQHQGLREPCVGAVGQRGRSALIEDVRARGIAPPAWWRWT
jgi:hypothetical protein